MRGYLLVFLAFFPVLAPAESVFRPGDVYTMCGDSITQQEIYSMDIEDYILMCQPVHGVRTIQCGWGGTGADHFAVHMKDTALPFAPSVATVFFGMNDGNFAAPTPANEQRFRESLEKAVDNFKQAGTRVIILGSPGAVDTYYFKNPHDATVGAAIYNQTLGRLSDVARDVAKEKGVIFADVHTPMMETMAATKAARGDKLSICGEMDGVHATPNGHLIMAYAFLKAMGFDGDIGTITYDAAAGTATATEGHRVVAAKPGEVTIESTRYPYCFNKGDNHPFGPTTSVLPYLPFNDELNRYMLVVKNLKSARAKITWGADSKEFTAAQLAKGINLAAEFLNNPFVPAFNAVDDQMRIKGIYESTIVTNYFGQSAAIIAPLLPEKAASLKSADAALRDIDAGLAEYCAQAVKPVVHVIKIEEEN
jgi:lysophospholipase L1-like esterase